MSELGYQSGAVTSWSAIAGEAHESNPDLMWPLSIEVFDRMRSEDSQVGSVLRAVTEPILSTEWVLDPAGAPDEVVQQIATDLDLPIKGQPRVAPLRTKGRFSWADHLRLALLMLPFGHAYFEQVYRIEGGRAHLAKLAYRPPRTIANVKVASDGGLEGIEQYGAAGKPNVFIPVDRLVAYVNQREGANWLGRSLLRTAYKDWLLKDRFLRIQAMTAERNGLGIPVHTAPKPPDSASYEEAEKWNKDQIAAGLKIAKGTRAGESAGASLPGGATLELVGVKGTLPDTDKPIRYHDEAIARAVLAHVLNLGGDNSTGSYALSDTLAGIFTNSLNATAMQIASILNQHVVEDLVDLNWGPTTRAPRIVPAPLGATQSITSKAIKELIESGAITVDDSLEADVRARYGLPVKGGDAAADTEDAVEAKKVARVADIIRQIYLGVGPVLKRREARRIARQAGADLDPDDDPDDPAEERA